MSGKNQAHKDYVPQEEKLEEVMEVSVEETKVEDTIVEETIVEEPKVEAVKAPAPKKEGKFKMVVPVSQILKKEKKTIVMIHKKEFVLSGVYDCKYVEISYNKKDKGEVEVISVKKL